MASPEGEIDKHYLIKQHIVYSAFGRKLDANLFGICRKLFDTNF
jgi:hypothetical protein